MAETSWFKNGNEYLGFQEDGRNHYYITDGQGSIRYVLGEGREVENEYRYGAFGECLYSKEAVENRLRYNAQAEDALTGLYYLRARYYNPTTGRFTQEDVP